MCVVLALKAVRNEAEPWRRLWPLRHGGAWAWGSGACPREQRAITHAWPSEIFVKVFVRNGKLIWQPAHSAVRRNETETMKTKSNSDATQPASGRTQGGSAQKFQLLFVRRPRPALKFEHAIKSMLK